MLIYLGMGGRRYGVTPFGAVQRHCWEFQAVVEGAIGMTIPGQPERLERRRLWLSPPGHIHGWAGEARKGAEVVVFQFWSVPEPLRRLFRDNAALEVALSEAACRRLRELAERAAVYWRCPSPGMVMCYEHVLLELSLMIYEARRAEDDGGDGVDNDRRVESALRWYSERVEQNPSLEEVAGAVNVSTSHLRRLFHEVLQSAPKQAFDQLRFQRAVQLMADPSVKLSAVSEACGFESQSAFSRAFKAKFGCAPDVWRE
ncbi:MAG: AraC family transcriptional regulator [Opitutaceae bacterium]